MSNDHLRLETVDPLFAAEPASLQDVRLGAETVSRRAVVSPIIEQELRASGAAQVMVFLSSGAAGAGAGAAAGTATGAALGAPAAARRLAVVASQLERHFRMPQVADAVSAALRAPAGAAAAGSARAGGRTRAARAQPQTGPTLFEHLGIMLGSVDRDGLDALQSEAAVDFVAGVPPISLVRPTRRAAAKAPTVTWGIEALGVPALWQQGLSGSGIRVGHLDTGVDARHPVLRAAVAGFAEFDLQMGAEIQPTPRPHDTDDHGTHTAATIAGRPHQNRHVGVAPGADLYSGLVIEGGNVVARILGGLNWVVGQRVRIVSVSLGLRGWWEEFLPVVRILRRHGILPVIAVGNEGPGTSRSPGNYAEALSVGAMNDRSAVPFFSSSFRFDRLVDAIVPDLVAPGVNVISAAPGGGYQAMDGTSMATPHIAGLAALLWEAKPDATPDQVEDAIFRSCTLPSTMLAERANRGMPNGPAAFALLTGTPLSAPASRTRARTPAARKRAARKRAAAPARKRAKRRPGTKRQPGAKRRSAAKRRTPRGR